MAKSMLKSNYFYKLWSRQVKVFHLIGFNQFFQKVVFFLTYKVIEILLYISAFPFVLLARIVSPWIIFRFGFIRNDVIGHGVFNPEHYLSEYEYRIFNFRRIRTVCLASFYLYFCVLFFAVLKNKKRA